MREIKFRAWDSNLDFMVEPGYCTADISSYARGKDYTLMQYTGLKDKNGVEIYEGDIVRVSTGGVMDGVESVKHGIWGWELGENPGMGWPGTPFLEVIGNIYENQELLENCG